MLTKIVTIGLALFIVVFYLRGSVLIFFFRDKVWDAHVKSAEAKGITHLKRTEAWERKTTLLGILSIFITLVGIALTILAILIPAPR
ncbi:MAG: hypothetical protein Phog2KO_49080 [Phototrophicaceae bacterium]